MKWYRFFVYSSFICTISLLNVSLGQFKSLDWIKSASIYEVNIRQFSEEGSFREFEKHLPRLKSMGIDVIWLMPIHPIGSENRKGGLGSYYAVKEYKKVNPEFGTLEDFKKLVNKAHELGMKIILDWVANHSSPDNIWLEHGHKDWYTLDSLGNIQPTLGTDWWDVADLNYDNAEMRKEMISSMKYWISETDIDGFRCDVAGWVPIDFWVEARKELESVKPVFMLAEAEGSQMYEAFDMTYGWEFHHIMNQIFQGDKGIEDIYTYFNKDSKNSSQLQMHFTSNHDENSWNGTVMERMGDSRFAFAVLAATIEGMPLIYNGQETSLDKRLRFFDKDTINWAKMDLVEFYTKIFALKESNSALWIGEGQGRMELLTNVFDDYSVLAFKRINAKNEVICIFNLSSEEVNFTNDVEYKYRKYTDLFSNQKVNLKRKKTMSFGPWEYRVYYKTKY
jgi:hypothetical protein